MKKLLILVLLILPLRFAFAQSTSDWRQDAGFLVGINKPLGKTQLQGDIQLGITYAHFQRNGIGFRTGLLYTPEVAELDHSFGIPIAFSWRTPSRDDSGRWISGLYGAADAVSSGGRGREMLSGFLLNLFSSAEFYAGVTPGWVLGRRGSDHYSSDGEHRWTERPFPLSLSLDAGMSLDYEIWRFKLKLMPAFHYLLTNNYRVYEEVRIPDLGIDHSHTHDVRWFFTFSGGLVFQF